MYDRAQPEWEAGEAPGAPGCAPTWSGGRKDLVGCALGPARLWYTVGQGIVNEVYYPRADTPQVRDLGFIVADGQGFWAEVRQLDRYTLAPVEPGVPVVDVLHRHERFTLRLRVCPDPRRDVLLVRVELDGDAGLKPYVLLAPRLGASGHDNRAWADSQRGRQVLWAERGPFALALLACDGAQGEGFGRTSVGFAGASDGWHDFAANGAMAWEYNRAGPGNVALTGELAASCVLALGFAASKESAATLAATALEQSFEDAERRLVEEWRAWHARCEAERTFSPVLPPSLQATFATSATVLRTHLDRTFPGAMVASLSVPWGDSRDARDGHHLVRIRDLVEAGTALLAIGALEEARDILRYLIATQDADGRWAATQWLGGKPAQPGGGLADTAYPVLLAAALSERGALEGTESQSMVGRALAYIVRHGPLIAGPGWERAGRLDAHVLGACIAALVTGARFIDQHPRAFALAVADYWNRGLEPWAAARGTALARRLGVAGYFRAAAADPGGAEEASVGTDALSLVRLGLRRPDDCLVLDSVRVIDALLRVRTPAGPAWRRFLGDRYGEHADGRPFDGGGLGRAWPLLSGERGHYEVASGRDPLAYLQAMAAMAGPGGLFPEQVWDGAELPERGLSPGRPTGAAMPLAWAHAEFVKLAVSRGLGRPVDRPAAVWRRYQGRSRPASTAVWATHAPIATIEAGQRLLVCSPRPARVHCSVDGWQRVTDVASEPTGLGLEAAELPTPDLSPGRAIDFTLLWLDSGEWHGRDYRVRVVAPSGPNEAVRR